MKILERLNSHLCEVDETYFEHFNNAARISVKLFLSSFFMMIHAIFPFLCPPFRTDIRSLSKYLDDKIKRYDKIED